MFKRLNNKLLLPIFLILLAVFLVVEYGGIGEEKAPIPSSLGRVDTNEVKRLIVRKGKDKGSYTLVKKEGDWKLKRKEQELNAKDRKVKQALSDLDGLSPQQLVARDSSKWGKYKVDGSGKRIEVEGEAKTLLTFHLGKMAVSRPDGGGKRRMMRRRKRPDIKFHVRQAGASKVYTVKGRPMMRFRRGSDPWIDGTLIDGPKMNWKQVTLRSADSSLTLSKEAGSWSAEKARMDSSAVQSYLTALSGMNTKELAEGVSSDALKEAALRLNIERKEKSPIEVKAYPAKRDTATSFYIESSLNPDMTFRDTDSSLYRKMIPGGSDAGTRTPKRPPVSASGPP